MGSSKLQKEVYIREFSTMITEHPDYFNEIEKLDDDDLLKKLTLVKGIGTWTAHMFLIFNMGRLDVLPLSDAGFRRGFNELYNDNGERLDDLKILSVSNKWKPFRSIGAWYLWKYIDSKPHP
jgi:DNA-3-methyladenine glycosylase II